MPGSGGDALDARQRGQAAVARDQNFDSTTQRELRHQRPQHALAFLRQTGRQGFPGESAAGDKLEDEDLHRENP